MRLMFISDIHGIKTNLEKVRTRFNELKCDKLVVLGDLYYIGPRNKMIDGYDINYVKDFLESFKDKILCVRGNCDSEIDIAVTNFPIISELGVVATENNDIYFTHGHIYNESNWNKINSILVYGHLHIPFIKQIETNLYINPGSISLPKSDIGPTYLIYDENGITIYDINNKVVEKRLI